MLGRNRTKSENKGIARSVKQQDDTLDSIKGNIYHAFIKKITCSNGDQSENKEMYGLLTCIQSSKASLTAKAYERMIKSFHSLR